MRFVPGAGGIVVRFDSQGGRVLRPRKGGAWNNPGRSADGLLEQATIWLSSDPGILDSCRGVIKITLHELDHLRGLGDNREYRGPSVMNRAFRKNELWRLIAKAPTACDGQQALVASREFDDMPSGGTLRTVAANQKWRRAPADIVLVARCPSS